MSHRAHVWIVAAAALGGGCGRTPHVAPLPPAPKVVHDDRVLTMADGVKLNVVSAGVAGSQTPLVIVSDGPGLSHEDVTPIIDRYARDRMVFTWDQRGVAPSTAPTADDGWDLAHQLSDLDAVRDAAGPQVDLIGHAWGGLLALAYTAAHPQQVRRLILIDAFPPDLPAVDRAEQSFLRRVGVLQRQGAIPRDLPPVEADDCAPRLRAQLPAYFAVIALAKSHPLRAKTCSAKVFLAAWHALGAYDLRPGLADLDLPVLVVQGAADPFGLMADDIVAALPQAREVVLPMCGHLPFEECPAELFSEVDAFL